MKDGASMDDQASSDSYTDISPGLPQLRHTLF